MKLMMKYLGLMSLVLSVSIAASANCANGRRQGLFSNIYYGVKVMPCGIVGLDRLLTKNCLTPLISVH